MKKWNIWIPAAIICLLCIFNNCKKARNREFVELDTDSTVNARLNFKTGTYWIYKDALTNRIDSFYVRNNVHATQDETYNTYNYHFITVVQQNIDGTHPADSANWVFNYQATRIMMEYDYTVNNYGWKNQIQFQPLYVFPFVYGDLKGKYDTAAIPKIDSYYTVNGLPFYRVAHVLHISTADSTMGPGITRYNDSFMVNDSVGLISMQINHPYHNLKHNWHLLRYNIVR